MLYDVIINEWDEVTYVPTTLGKALLAGVVIVLLYGAVWCARRYAATQAAAKENHTETKKACLQSSSSLSAPWPSPWEPCFPT